MVMGPLVKQVLQIMDMKERYKELDCLTKEELLYHLMGIEQRVARLEILGEQIYSASELVARKWHS